MSKRILKISALLDQKSHFLFGPRGTGKTTLIKQELSDKAVLIDLLRSGVYRSLSAHPEQLEEMIESQITDLDKKWVVIDEVQKIPSLLDEVHRLIEEKKWRFLLTGSSARKLKSQNVNMLGGRARKSEMFPFAYPEFEKWNLSERLLYGSLPIINDSKQPREDIEAYVDTYLKEEILQEGIIRKLEPFSRFLTVAALSSGELINFSNVGSDAQVAASTVAEHFQILVDTLMGFRLEPWVKSRKRKAIMTAKFYFFDCGITNALAEVKSIDRNSDLFGKRFEQMLIGEVRAYNSYFRRHSSLSFWREKHGLEVDLLVDQDIAIEFKATARVSDRDQKGLRALKEEKVFKKYYLISNDPVSRLKDGIQMLHYEKFLKLLWSEKIF